MWAHKIIKRIYRSDVQILYPLTLWSVTPLSHNQTRYRREQGRQKKNKLRKCSIKVNLCTYREKTAREREDREHTCHVYMPSAQILQSQMQVNTNQQGKMSYINNTSQVYCPDVWWLDTSLIRIATVNKSSWRDCLKHYIALISKVHI